MTPVFALSYYGTYALPEEAPPSWSAGMQPFLASLGLLQPGDTGTYDRYGLVSCTLARGAGPRHASVVPSYRRRRVSRPGMHQGQTNWDPVHTCMMSWKGDRPASDPGVHRRTPVRFCLRGEPFVLHRR